MMPVLMPPTAPNNARFSHRMQTPNLQPLTIQSKPALSFQGCQMTEKITSASELSLIGGFLSAVLSIIPLGVTVSEHHPSTTWGCAAKSLETQLTPATSQTPYLMPEMEAKAMSLQKEALTPILEDMLRQVFELSEDPLERVTLKEHLQDCLEWRTPEQAINIKTAFDKAAQGLIDLGIDTLQENPEAEKAILKTLAYDLLNEKTSPEFQARFNALMDDGFQAYQQAIESHQGFEKGAITVFGTLLGGGVGLIGTGGFLGWLAIRRKRKQPAPMC
jgi:hypothetical protein